MRKLLIFLLLCSSAFGQLTQDNKPIPGMPIGGQFAEGLIGLWTFVGPAGNLPDLSHFGNHGIITGATWQGQGLSFDGTGDNVGITDTPELRFGTGDFAIIVRVFKNTIQSAGFPQIMGKGDVGVGEWMFGESNATMLRFFGDGGNINISSGAGTWVRNRWYTVAAVRNGGIVTLYVDGVASGQDVSAGSDLNDVTNLQLGGADSDNNRWLDGIIEYAAIYNRALSASEIQALYIDQWLAFPQTPIWMFFTEPAAGGNRSIFESLIFGSGVFK